MDFNKDLNPYTFVEVKDIGNTPLINDPNIIGMVKGVIVDTIGYDDWCLEDEFTSDIGLDSLTFVGLISNTEKVFKIRLNEWDMEEITTPQDLINYVEWKLGI